MSFRRTVLLFLLTLMLLPLATSRAGTLEATPADYREKVKALRPGDVLRLSPGTFDRGLTVRDLHGRPDAWIVIRGPAEGEPARFLADPQARRNTVEIRSGSYVAIENLHLDGGDVGGVFAIHASGSPVHHIRIEGCRITGHGAGQQTVAISTKTPTWNWVIRRNVIEGAGTGMYLGNSDGTDPFVAGLIEHNLVRDSRGYNLQIKRQDSRPDVEGMPREPARTIIRHNVFVKTERRAEDGPRPSVLIGGLPDEGPGSDDRYEIYGNLFHGAHDEAQLQACGDVSIHDNLFVAGRDLAIRLMRHERRPLERAWIYHNTFLDVRVAMRFLSRAREDHRIVGNLVLGGRLARGIYFRASDNLVIPRDEVDAAVRNAEPLLGTFDLRPAAGACAGDPVSQEPFAADTDHDRDFDGHPKGEARRRGAYQRTEAPEAWRPDAGIKPAPGR